MIDDRAPISATDDAAARSTSTLDRAVHDLALEWRRKLTSVDRRNPALFFRELKAGTYAMPALDSEELRALVNDGRAMDLGGADADASLDTRRRLKAIAARAKENEEERGIQTLFVALGMATWKAEDGGRDPYAPMLFLPVRIVDSPRGMQLARNGDLVINRVMLQAWEDDYHLDLAALDADDRVETSIDTAYAEVQAAGAPVPNFVVTTACFLSNFSFDKMAMVEDLKRHEDVLRANTLVQALAGDRAAQQAIRDATGSLERSQLDAIDPADELIVLEADEYQRQAVHALTRFEASGVIDGPPGTGKSQTIANLIATLVGQGKKVLFVAEKRAALEAVRNRLAAADLGSLVLDLHGADATRKTVYERLKACDAAARRAPTTDATADAKRLTTLRSSLNAYYAAVNEPIDACAMTPRDLIARIGTAASTPGSTTRWYGDACRALTQQSFDDAVRNVELLANDASLFRRDASVPWACADPADDGAIASALQNVTETRTACEAILSRSANAALAANIGVTTLASLGTLCATLAAFRTTSATYTPEVLDAVDELARDLAPASRGALQRFFSSLFDSAYRAALTKARGLAIGTSDPERLCAAAQALAAVPAAQRGRALFALASATAVDDLEALRKRIADGARRFASDTKTELPTAVADAIPVLRAHEAANMAARRIAEIRRAENALVHAGYAPFVDELRVTPTPPDRWAQLLDDAWSRSHLEEVKSTRRALGTYTRARLEATLAEFRTVDARYVKSANITVRERAAELYIAARNAHPDQATVVAAEFNKKIRQMPVRKFVQRAGDVVTALCPCWMASPLSVSRLIAGRVLFDVVIFDEASQVLPEDAIPAIMRGKRTIVAGDQKQLPPTNFFAAGGGPSNDTNASDDETEEDDERNVISVDGMESILDVMLTFCGRQNLNVHYRSRDESLIRFSNHEFYDDRLVTFPAPGHDDAGIRHELVPSPDHDGEELSSSAEVARVTDLVFDHAERRPHESLGIIAMGIRHANRIAAAIDERRKTRRDVDAFFARDDVNRAFFVKNLERVQGDERDAIIVSLGYAKDRSGRLKNKLGPLNYAGGERRLNVAVTRSKTRMLVTSTFTEEDMGPGSFAAPGARALCRFVEYARSGGKRLSDVAPSDIAMNPFERDIYETLTAQGLKLVPQLGVSSYRLDFAVLHPTIPNRYVLAIECDGASYHSSATARDRDRLRQAHLEAMGWRFHRIWSLDWFEERAQEIARAREAYAVALAADEARLSAPTVPPSPTLPPSPTMPQPASDATDGAGQSTTARARRPTIPHGATIGEYSDEHIAAILTWIASDGILRDDEELLREVVPALGFARRGKLINERLQHCITNWRRTEKQR